MANQQSKSCVYIELITNIVNVVYKRYQITNKKVYMTFNIFLQKYMH